MLNPALNLIYWADSGTGKIQRASLDGSPPEDLVTGLKHPNGIAIAGSKIYWTDCDVTRLPQNKEGTIKWANLNGSSPKDLPITQFVNPTMLALDISANNANKMIYWADISGGSIQRANLNGSQYQVLHNTTSLGGIALDVPRNKIYWTNPVQGKIQRANLDGSPPEDFVTGLESPNGIAIAGGKIYWTDMVIPSKIQCANLDEFQGRSLNHSQVDTLVVIPCDFLPFGIAIDVPRGKIYWTIQGMGPTEGTGAIQRANLDGSEYESLPITGLKSPSGIALYARQSSSVASAWPQT